MNKYCNRCYYEGSIIKIEQLSVPAYFGAGVRYGCPKCKSKWGSEYSQNHIEEDLSKIKIHKVKHRKNHMPYIDNPSKAYDRGLLAFNEINDKNMYRLGTQQHYDFTLGYVHSDIANSALYYG